jgi:hypothetical protein
LLIKLKGRVRRVLYKNENVLKFIFEDDELGRLSCTAGKKECFLYRRVKRNQRYELQAQLKGRESMRGNQMYLNNHLFIKYAKEID